MSNNRDRYPNDPRGYYPQRNDPSDSGSRSAPRAREVPYQPQPNNPPPPPRPRRRDSASAASTSSEHHALAQHAQRYPVGQPEAPRQHRRNSSGGGSNQQLEPTYYDELEYENIPRRRQQLERSTAHGVGSHQTLQHPYPTQDYGYGGASGSGSAIGIPGPPRNGYTTQYAGQYPPSTSGAPARYPPAAGGMGSGRRMSMSSADPMQGQRPPLEYSLPHRPSRQSGSYENRPADIVVPARGVPEHIPGPRSSWGTQLQPSPGYMQPAAAAQPHDWAVVGTGGWSEQEPIRPDPSPSPTPAPRQRHHPLQISIERGPPADPNAPLSPARTDREWSIRPERGSNSPSSGYDDDAPGPSSGTRSRRDQGRESSKAPRTSHPRDKEEKKRKHSVSEDRYDPKSDRDRHRDRDRDRDRDKDRDRDRDSSGKSGRPDGRRDSHHRT